MGVKVQRARKADILITLCELIDCLENVGALTSHNPMGLNGLLQALPFYHTFMFVKAA
jgi:hypothetical protein